MRRSLTGIKPTGDVHVGNWLGAIEPAKQLTSSFESFYFIADYHAMTSVRDADQLRASSREVAATWLALGLDPEKTVIWRQSAVPEVQELAWILACQASTGVLERGHAVKAAKDGNQEVSIGTWFYPILMAADILLFDTDVVPVGQDQKQHIEVTRELARKVNHQFGEGTLVVPEPLIQENVATIPGLDGRKMSKSYGNTIPLWLPPKKLRKLVMKIVTDSRGVDDIKDPDSDNIFNLYKLLATPEQVADLRERYLKPGMGYGHAKQELFEVLDGLLSEPRDRYNAWLQDPDGLEDVLSQGANKARVAANATMSRVRERVGLI